MSEIVNVILYIIRVETKNKNTGVFIINKKPIGRPKKVDYKIITMLEDALRYGATVSEACYYAGISRDTFYRYFRDEDAFSKKMEDSRNKYVKSAKENVAQSILNGDYENSGWLQEKVVTPSLVAADEISKV